MTPEMFYCWLPVLLSHCLIDDKAERVEFTAASIVLISLMFQQKRRVFKDLATLPQGLRELDVVVLSEVCIKRIFALRTTVDAEKHKVEYISGADEAIIRTKKDHEHGGEFAIHCYFSFIRQSMEQLCRAEDTGFLYLGNQPVFTLKCSPDLCFTNSDHIAAGEPQSMNQIEPTSLETTADTLFDGAMHCRQYRNGYRFSIDSVLLAHFYQPARKERVLDLGAGCGIVGLVMLYRWQEKIECLRGIELQPELQRLAEANLNENGFEKKGRVIQGDIREVLKHFSPESFSLVTCNPPFYRQGNGRQSVDSQAKAARHQVAGTIEDFAIAAAKVLKKGGSAIFIYPAESFSELNRALSSVQLEIKQLQFVYSYPGSASDAKLVLVRCVKGAGMGMKVLEPLYIYKEKNGSYSEQVKALYAAKT